MKTKELNFEILKYTAAEDGARIDAVVSSRRKDSDGDVIGDWDLKSFKTHPVMLANHRNDLTSQIGKWSNFRKDGDELIATAEYFTDGDLPHNIMAQIAFDLAKRNAAAFSIRAQAKDNVVIYGQERIQQAPDIPADVKKQRPQLYVPTAILREISQVALPANMDALQRSDDFDLDDWILRMNLKNFNARMSKLRR